VVVITVTAVALAVAIAVIVSAVDAGFVEVVTVVEVFGLVPVCLATLAKPIWSKSDVMLVGDDGHIETKDVFSNDDDDNDSNSMFASDCFRGYISWLL